MYSWIVVELSALMKATRYIGLSTLFSLLGLLEVSSGSRAVLAGERTVLRALG
jgi:hypothetical protein